MEKREGTLRLVSVILLTVAFALDCMGLDVRTSNQQLVDADLQATRQLATEFTSGFVRTMDLAPLIKEHFAKDFIERFTKNKAQGVARSVKVYFVPGLEYDSRLLSEASADDWLRLYTTANNFLFFGIMSGIKNSRNSASIGATQLYPQAVIKLLNTNPTLANMIVRKGSSKPIDSVAEMQQATAVLDQAVALMREQAKGQAPLKIDDQELVKAMQEDEFFRPVVESAPEHFFGLVQGTQVVFINTPILFRLTLAKLNNRWEILWADPVAGG